MKTRIIVKRLRSKVGLTQKAMADKLGVSRQYINKMETTDTDLHLQNFIKLCKAVGYTDYNELFTEEETEK